MVKMLASCRLDLVEVQGLWCKRMALKEQGVRPIRFEMEMEMAVKRRDRLFVNNIIISSGH
jgi:hypothetical protein